MFYLNTNKEMLVEGDKTGLSETSKLLLNNYEKMFSYSNYKSHITLGCYDTKFDGKLPIKFKSDTIALAQIGDGCTCRKIIYKTNLKS